MLVLSGHAGEKHFFRIEQTEESAELDNDWYSFIVSCLRYANDEKKMKKETHTDADVLGGRNRITWRVRIIDGDGLVRSHSRLKSQTMLCGC